MNKEGERGEKGNSALGVGEVKWRRSCSGSVLEVIQGKVTVV